MVHYALFWLLIAGFFFFRYLRANKTVAYLIPNFAFLGIAIYKTENVMYIFLIIALIILEIYAAYLKENKHPIMLKIQKGYKPGESILHYIIFAIIVFITSVVMRLIR